jgi:leucyl-tRNA synthetase
VVPTDELPVLRDAPRVRPCPACGEPAERDPDTLDTFVCSSWYAFRFADPHNAEAPFSRQAVDRWMPIDVYVGGLEHAGQHMIYFRFVTAVLHDLGLVGFSEPVKQFFCNGMVKLGGRKMSKSSGCSVGPDEVVEQFGPDALRLAILGDGPADQDQEWDPEGPARKARFLRRMEAGIEAWRGRWDVTEEPQRDAAFYRALAPLRADIEENRFHVGVARLHSAANRLRQVMDVDVTGSARAMVQDWLVAMSPFAPAFASRLSRHFFDVDVHATPWPEVEPGSLDGALRMVAVQVNGRTIGQVAVAAGADNAEHTRAAMAHPAVSRRGGATPRRVIVVPGRVVNLVMAPPRTSDAP